MTEYSFLTGLKKTLKNVTLTFVLPAGVYLLSNATAWFPDGYEGFAALLVSLGAYLTKNYLENK